MELTGIQLGTSRPHLDWPFKNRPNQQYAAEQQSTNTETPQLSEEAKELLIEATKVNSGLIQKIGLANGKLININGKALNELGNRRSEAKWEGALDELIERRLVKDYNGKGKAFEVTHKGFEVTDTLKGP